MLYLIEVKSASSTFTRSSHQRNVLHSYIHRKYHTTAHKPDINPNMLSTYCSYISWTHLRVVYVFSEWIWMIGFSRFNLRLMGGGGKYTTHTHTFVRCGSVYLHDYVIFTDRDPLAIDISILSRTVAKCKPRN